MEPGIGDANFHVYKDRQWLNPVNNLGSRWPNASTDLTFADSKHGFRNIDARAWFFTDYYSISPGMVSMTSGKGAFYMIAFKDASGDWLNGQNNYKLTLPPDIPAELFWSVTLYEAENASGLDNGQPFPRSANSTSPRRMPTGAPRSTSVRKHRRVRRATGSPQFRVADSSRSCASTPRRSPRSTEAGSRATS